MSRPKAEQPTPGELEILKVLWQAGPCTGRQVLAALPSTRAYTSVMSLLNIMVEKGLVSRSPHGRAFIYKPKGGRRSVLGQLVNDLLRRAFEGSASTLVTHLLEEARPTTEELSAIRQSIADYLARQERAP